MQPTKARRPRQRELDGNSTGIRREYDGNPPMAADQRSFLPLRSRQSDRLPLRVTNCHNHDFFFALSTGQTHRLLPWRLIERRI
jgi:hypothetical protein